MSEAVRREIVDQARHSAALEGLTPSPEQEKLMDQAANVEVAYLERRLNVLSIVAGVAPLLGFIGTIAGVITIFFDISTTADISIGVISEGLYQKMVSSAGGLVVGIIAFVFYQLLQIQHQYIYRYILIN